MLKDKVLVNLYVLKLDQKYEIYLPVNEKVGNVVFLLEKNLFEAETGVPTKNSILFNLSTGSLYNYDTILRDTDVENQTNLLLI